MTRFRSFLEHSETAPEDTFSLSPEESHHLLRVRRAKTGDSVAVFDSRGNEYECILSGVSEGRALLKIDSRCTRPPPHFRITLAQAILKGPAMDQVVQRATELGVSRIMPISSQRSVTSLSDSRFRQKLSRWRSITIEACKQSGNPYLPAIDSISSLADFCGQLPEDSFRVIGSLDPQAISLNLALTQFRRLHPNSDRDHSICLIGPEGDFTAEEYQLAHNAGFISITLGDNTLRSETAAIVSIALLNHELT